MTKANYINNNALKKTGKILLGVFGFLLFLSFSVPYFFSNSISKLVKDIANEQLTTEVEFQDLSLSFWEHFPNLTVSLKNVQLKGSNPSDTTALVKANKIGLGINLSSLFQDAITFKKVYVDNGQVHVFVDTNGVNNYNIFKTDSTDTDTDTTSSSTALRIQSIELTNTDIAYIDLSSKVDLQIAKLNYQGKGDFMNAVFDLFSDAEAQSITFAYDSIPYVQSKKLGLHLTTSIDTQGPAFAFDGGTVQLDSVPLSLGGEFKLTDTGYKSSITVSADSVALNQLITLLPPSFEGWVANTLLAGNSTTKIQFLGEATPTSNPDLIVHFAVENGRINQKGIEQPVTDLYLKTTIKLPQLATEQLETDTDTLHFNLGNGYFKAYARTKGISFPLWFDSQFDGQLDLEQLDNAIAIPGYDFKGLMNVQFKGEGIYNMAIRKKGLREEMEHYISSVPKFTLSSSVKNGYFKFNELPEAIHNISFDLHTNNQSGKLENTHLAIKDINANVLQNALKGYINVTNFKTYPVDAHLIGHLKLDDIPLFMPLDSIEVKGDLHVDFKAKGTFEPKKELFPITESHFTLTKGYFQSLAYPIPLEDISVQTIVSSKRGSYKDLSVKILPIQFKMGGEPFALNADIKDFENLSYKINSKGSLDIGQIYRIFAIDGYDVKGKIKSNFSLQGSQKDAISGDFDKLMNRGRLILEDLIVRSDLFPKPYAIKQGFFKFFQEKMVFEKFEGKYGSNVFQVDGFLTNVLPYLFNPHGKLNGNFVLNSPKINLNEFMFDAPASSTTATSSNSSGVILLPENTSLGFKASIAEVLFNDIPLQNFKGQLTTTQEGLLVDSTQFEIAGATVHVNATYAPKSPKSATFTSNINAQNFDVERAYNEVPLFREMATSAKDLGGKVSLDYDLSGRLNANMEPVMPSIAGKGTLTLEDIQFKGFKLLGAISKQTEKKDLSNEKVSKVEIKSSIQNNVMTIERTKMKMAGFRPRFEGQVTLDGEMNIGFRLGLPPLGLIGIPMRITGNADNFQIKLGKYSEKDLEEEDTEEADEEEEKKEEPKETTSTPVTTSPATTPKEEEI